MPTSPPPPAGGAAPGARGARSPPPSASDALSVHTLRESQLRRFLAAGSSGAVVTNSGTSSVTITGTVAQINNLLTSNATSTVSYIDNTDTPSASSTLTLTVHDNGNTGTGGDLVSVATSTINITAVNATGPGYLTVYAGTAPAKGELKAGAKSFKAGSLGSFEIAGDNILLGTPFIFNKGNIDQFDF